MIVQKQLGFSVTIHDAIVTSNTSLERERQGLRIQDKTIPKNRPLTSFPSATREPVRAID